MAGRIPLNRLTGAANVRAERAPHRERGNGKVVTTMVMTPEDRVQRAADLGRFERWLVVGPGGAGKTTLALELSRILQLPIIHLDRHYWRPGWIPPASDEWSRHVTELADREKWIMDGNYSGTLELRLRRAQVAVMLDPPTIRCLGGVLRRMWTSRKLPRPDLAAGCTERLVPDPEFLYYVATYRKRSRPKVLARIGRASHVRFIQLSSRREADNFLRALKETTG